MIGQSPLPAEILDGEDPFDADDDFGPLPKYDHETPPATAADFALRPTFEAETPDEASVEPSTPNHAEPQALASNPVGALLAGVESALGEATVPRITIHVFCQRPDTAQIAQRASEDRRLARATTEIRPGGLIEALQHYQTHPTPPLIIVESMGPPADLLASLDRLAEVCDPGTKVLVIGEHNDIALYRELMRRGVSEYLVPPLLTLQLIRAITTLYTDPAVPFVGRAIAFVGAKGGAGSSTLAHNIAYQISEAMQANTVIADFDLPFGTAGLDFNQDPAQGLGDALSKPERLDATLLDRMTARCSDRLALFAAPASLDDDYDISAEAYDEVQTKIRGSAPYVVMDLPHLWSAWMRRMILSSDDVVITALPDLASLRNAKNLIDLIKKARPNDDPPHLILNQVGAPGRPEIPVKEFAKALGAEPALVLPFDAKLFGQAANNGQMVFEVNAKAKAAEGLMQFTQLLTRREPIVPKERSLIERLLGKT